MTLTRSLWRVLTLLPAILPLAQNLARAQAAPATIASKATGFERRDGFIPVYVDAKSGKLLLELPGESLTRDIDLWLEHGEVPPMSPALVAPPGDPFGIPEDLSS